MLFIKKQNINHQFYSNNCFKESGQNQLLRHIQEKAGQKDY